MTDLSEEALRALPKAELHLHLEGSVAATTLADLARKHGLALPSRDLDALYVFDDLASFLRMYRLVCAAVRDADDFFRMTCEALASIGRSGGRYAEVFSARMRTKACPTRRSWTGFWRRSPRSGQISVSMRG